ncbi:glucose 1-dehydrogenase [Labrys okinawensis]|uniref:glucose 1-dehydrogenase n=1 Tax=Labrys okinawensis TaxID=346911 RepID=UPI0039BC327A
MGRLSGKVAVITGAASGIGLATAELFVREGARLVIADLQDGKGERLAERLGPAVDYRHADVTVEDDIAALVAHAVHRHGQLDVLFNNAGAPAPGGPIADISAADFDAGLAVLLRSVFLGMKHAAPVMQVRKSGSILSTASIAGVGAGHASHIYSTAKAAVIHLTRMVANELGEDNIRVNCLCPGGTATPLFGRAVGLDIEAADRSVELMKTVLATNQPIPRAGLPEDVAQAALWLASDEASFVTGQAIAIDGGLTLGRRWSAAMAGWTQLGSALEALR